MIRQGPHASNPAPHPSSGGAHGAVRDWVDALVTVLAVLAAMAVVAALGLWAAGAADLPGGAFPRVVAAVVVIAAGGSVGVSGRAGGLAGTDAELTVMPLSVTLTGALVAGWSFLRPLRHHAVTRTGELLARVGRTAVLWLAALAALTALARHTFTIVPPDSPIDIIGGLLDATPTVGFQADLGPTLAFGLLWLLGVLAMALLVSRRAPLPARLLRYQAPVRPAAFAMLFLLLAYVVIGLVVGLIVAATRGHAAQTFAVILLGLPNVVWLALGLGIGASWEGRVEGPFGLPMPHVLDAALRGSENTTLDVAALAEHDGRAWLLIPVAAVLLLAAAFVMAVRSPAGTRLWQYAVHLGVAFALTMLVVVPLTRVVARLGLSILGIVEIKDLGGQVALHPNLWTAVGLALLWGLVIGPLGGLLAARVHRRGEIPPAPGAPVRSKENERPGQL
ncbi:streptophobe family protein [Streptomyces lavendulocolor]|uniref:streptophobe family protein n=1 Tax=Streptomyces lavendulocolor TaxID=67316 RepID=UPI0033EE6207